MAWVCANEEQELIWEFEPRRFDGSHEYEDWCDGGDYFILPKGSIKKLIGRDLTWEDEPVNLDNI